MLKDKINEAIHEGLRAKNMTASDLARELKITPQHVSNLLNGKRRWNETLLNNVVQILDLEIQIKVKAMAGDRMKQKYTCKNCKYCCPFLNGNLGNCELDMKEIDIEKDRCKKFKLSKDI